MRGGREPRGTEELPEEPPLYRSAAELHRRQALRRRAGRISARVERERASLACLKELERLEVEALHAL